MLAMAQPFVGGPPTGPQSVAFSKSSNLTGAGVLVGVFVGVFVAELVGVVVVVTVAVGDGVRVGVFVGELVGVVAVVTVGVGDIVFVLEAPPFPKRLVGEVGFGEQAVMKAITPTTASPKKASNRSFITVSFKRNSKNFGKPHSFSLSFQEDVILLDSFLCL